MIKLDDFEWKSLKRLDKEPDDGEGDRALEK